MSPAADPALARALARWAFTAVHPVADTPTGRVLRVTLPGDSFAVLKLLKPYGAGELPGARLMQWLEGHGAARILDIDGLAILMEWLDGPPLADLVRVLGEDGRATQTLCDLALQFRRPRTSPPPLMPLRQQFAALFDADPGLWPDRSRAPQRRALDLATALFASVETEIPLHGDLHHDNVLNSARGWLAIDPKGLIGDPHYEVANVFRNPYGAGELARRPQRIERLADAFAARLNLNRKRLLGWAAVHSAISACWDRMAGNAFDFDLAMLPLLLAAYDRA